MGLALLWLAEMTFARGDMPRYILLCTSLESQYLRPRSPEGGNCKCEGSEPKINREKAVITLQPFDCVDPRDIPSSLLSGG